MNRLLVRSRVLAGVMTAVIALLIAGCSAGTGGGAFTFVSPGGKTELSYSGAQRSPIDDLSGPDLTGTGPLKLSDYAGKVVVLNFWGSWCAPCRAEAPGLNKAARALAPRGVQFLGVDVKDSREGGTDFSTAFQVPYPSIFDPTMRILLSLRGYPASSIPSTIVLDRSHRVSHIWLLPVTAGQVIGVVSAVAAEST